MAGKKAPSISENKKRGRGRPKTGHDPAVTVRLPKELIGAIELLANKSGMSRADVIRNLIEQSLDALAGAKKAHRTRE